MNDEVYGRVRVVPSRFSDKTLQLSHTSGDPDVIGRLVLRLADWYLAWAPGGKLGHIVSSAYILTFWARVISVLPATFAAGFKRLLAATLAFSTEGVTPDIPASVQDSRLGLADRYKSLITSVCYEHIEKHVVETCAGKSDEPMLSWLREWMAGKVMLRCYHMLGAQRPVSGSPFS
ncbi:hypothetical protein V8E53_006939 [Lactarius tabidus]